MVWNGYRGKGGEAHGSRACGTDYAGAGQTLSGGEAGAEFPQSLRDADRHHPLRTVHGQAREHGHCAAVPPVPGREGPGKAGAGGAGAADQGVRAVPQQGKEHHRGLPGAGGALRRRGAPDPRGADGAAGRGPEDRRRGADGRLRRSPDSRGHPRVSPVPQNRPGRRGHPGEGGKTAAGAAG